MLWWMAALTVLMVYEKTGRFGSAVVRPAGVVLLGAAALQLAHPAWLLSSLGGSKAFASSARIGRAPIHVGAYEVRSGLVPGAFRAGALSLQLSRRGSPLSGPGMRATFTMLDMDMPSVSASFAETGIGRYQASMPPLGMAGCWGLRVEVVPRHAARFTVGVVDEVGT